MLQIRRDSERGSFDRGWLKSKHSFSFSEYYDSRHMRFRMLRVINEDWVQPGSGFPTHAHENMEILTYVISGTLTHADSLGNKGTIQAGEIQRMTAGSGIEHSEYNEDSKNVCHLLQIWIFPNAKDIAPSWEQIDWKSKAVSDNGMRLLASPDGADQSAKIHQDAAVWHGSAQAGAHQRIEVAEGRGGWLQLVSGSLVIDGTLELTTGDAVAVENQRFLTIAAMSDSEFLWFDLA